MAQFKPIAGLIIGSIQGLTFQRSAQGYTVRGKPIGVQPNTYYQSVVKSDMAGISRSWTDDLTALQRSGWAGLAATVTRHNKYGDPYTPSGYQLYNELNSNLLKCALTALTDPPSNLNVEEIATYDLQPAGYEDDSVFIQNVQHPLPADHYVVGSLAVGIPAGQQAYQRYLYWTGRWTYNDFPGEYRANIVGRKGYARLDTMVWSSVSLVNAVNGVVSIPKIDSDTVIIP